MLRVFIVIKRVFQHVEKISYKQCIEEQLIKNAIFIWKPLKKRKENVIELNIIEMIILRWLTYYK